LDSDDPAIKQDYPQAPIARMVGPERGGTSRPLAKSFLVLFAAVVVGVVVYVASKAIPAKYASSATVAVSVSGSDVNDTSLGADNLASQYAQQVSATPVLQAAIRRLDADIPSGSVSGGVVGGQNVVSIEASADSASLAQERASAVTSAFIAYVNTTVANQASTYTQSAQVQLAPLTEQIKSVQSQLSKASASTIVTTATSAETAALEQQLGTLIAERASAFSAIAQTSVAGRPSLRLVSAAGLGGKTTPKPPLYALVGFFVALLIGARVAVSSGTRRAAT
jgi:hypothetical protein